MLVEWVDQQRHTIRTHRKMNANFQNFRKLFLFYFYLDSINHLEKIAFSNFGRRKFRSLKHLDNLNNHASRHKHNLINKTNSFTAQLSATISEQYVHLEKNSNIQKPIKGQMNSSLRRHKWEW